MTADPQAPAWTLASLLAGWAETALPELPVAGLTLDSRAVTPGLLFLAVPGTRAHGLNHAHEASARGAVAIVAEPTTAWPRAALARLSAELNRPVVPLSALSERASALAARFYGDPSAALEVFGITGTNGKTSVGHFLAQALTAAGVRCGIIGTLGHGLPEALSAPALTTPDAVRLHALLAALRQSGATAVTMEVSSHALAQKRADAVRFDYALLTNISRDHLDYHGDMATYVAAKMRLFHLPGLSWMVLNADDPLGRTLLAERNPQVTSACYSLDPAFAPHQLRGGEQCAVWMHARRIDTQPDGLRLELASSGGQGTLTVPLLGQANAANLLAALTTLLARGAALDEALAWLRHTRGVPGRMECFGGGALPLAVVDFAHTPDALEQALTHLRRHCQGQLICVFGCGGERDPGKRPAMGAIAERLADQVWLTDDNPRGENGDTIIAAIRAGMNAPQRAHCERQRAQAIRQALAGARPGDVVLIAGKGHETVQDMGELKIPFSDRAQVAQALREWPGAAGKQSAHRG